MKKEANIMTQVIRDLKATMTPEQFRNEILGGIAFIIGFPLLFAALWIVTPN
jgi:hypothetical protein